MRYTRRDFLTAAVAAGIGGSAGCSRQSQPANRLSGAPGVELQVSDTALPDYSHDLERYLVRVTNEARDRRKQVISAISTRQQIADRQKAVVDTVYVHGSGEWNGKAGYTFEMRAVDAGEPGKEKDRFKIIIRDAHSDTVASVSEEIDSGNIQSYKPPK